MPRPHRIGVPGLVDPTGLWPVWGEDPGFADLQTRSSPTLRPNKKLPEGSSYFGGPLGTRTNKLDFTRFGDTTEL